MGKKSRNKNRAITENTSPLKKSAHDAQKPASFPHKAWIYAFAVALVTFIVYIPALNNGFLNWDDQEYVTENSSIKAINFALFKWIFGFNAANWHPLTWLSHSIDYAIWGLNPYGHHLTSVILHSANTFLLCILIIYLIINSKDTKDYRILFRKAIITGCTASLLFGIIPVHVESVAWVSERKDVLSTFFVLLSLIFYVRYSTGTSAKLRFNYSLCLLFFALALLSKPMAITLPAVFILLDIYPFKRFTLAKNLKFQYGVLTEKIPLFY